MRKVVCLMLAAGALCFGGTSHSKISPDFRNSIGSGMTQVIVQWNGPMSPVTAQEISNLGGTVVSEMPAVQLGVYLVPGSAVPALSSNPNVKYVSPDRQIHKKLAVAAAAINAPSVWKSGFVGTGVGVAIVDSGVNADPNLNSGKDPIYVEDFVNPIPLNSDGKPGPKPNSYGLDWYGHGQHIAGIIASNGKDSNCNQCNKTFIGIAPGANIIDLKVLDSNGEGSDSAVIAAINRAIQLRKTYNIRVMNLSLGRNVYESYTEDPLCQAVEAAWKAGITVVVAAGNEGRDNSFGNDGYGTITSPGNDPYVITVGAMKTEGTPTRTDDLIASYSSKGPTAIDHIVKPDIVAPGNQMVSLLAQHGTLAMSNPQNVTALEAFQYPAPKPGNFGNQHAMPNDPNAQPPGVAIPGGYSHSYYMLSGTSMAAAVVSGAAADLIQAAPSLTPDQVKYLLMQTASKTFPVSSTVVDQTSGQIYTDYYDIFTIGAGYIDLRAAMAAINQAPSGLTALSPVANYDGATGDVELSFDPSSIFANKALWGTNSTWGQSVLTGNKALWGTSAIWGASSDAGQKALWGTNAIWSSKALWGTSDASASESVATTGEQ